MMPNPANTYPVDKCKRCIIRKFLRIALFILLPISAYSQDPSFSLFSNNKLYFNPGYVGSTGKIDMLIHYRRYLMRLPVKFEHIYFSIEYPFKKMQDKGLGGLGLLVYQNMEGDGYLKTSNIGVPFSTRVKISRKTIIQFGIMPSVVFKSIEMNRFIFGNQLNPYRGFDPNISPPPETGNLPEKIPPFLDFSFGFSGRYIKEPQNRNLYNSNCWEFGIAIHHWPIEVNQTFINNYAPMPFKIVAFLQHTYLFEPYETFIQPSLIFERQATMSTVMISARIIKESFSFGFGLRHEQTRLLSFNNFTFTSGYSVFGKDGYPNSLWICIGVDLPLKSEYNMVNSAFEISINYKLGSLNSICKPRRLGIGNTINFDR